MSLSHPTSSPGVAGIVGMAGLARRLIAGEHDAAMAELAQRHRNDPDDVSALFDMAMLLRLTGKGEQSQALQASALRLRSCFTCRHGEGQGLKVLVLVSGADVMSNAPIDFLCEDADMTLHFLHLDAEAPCEIPPHDVTFVALGLSDANRPLLEKLSNLLKSWPSSVMNAAPERVMAMTRDRTSTLFEDCPQISAPANVRVSRHEIERLAEGVIQPQSVNAAFVYPLLIRPLDTHGGKGLERIDHASNWRAYLDLHRDEAFFLAPFVDYSDSQGRYPKLRITFVDGRPFATHMALSDHWLAHYISAGMLESAEKRAVEEAWMNSFDQDFAVRHGEALGLIAARFGVDYFSIDCAETRDGRLLLFEADVASIVHALDPTEIFPYKRPAMDTLFTAFRTALRRRADVRAAAA